MTLLLVFIGLGASASTAQTIRHYSNRVVAFFNTSDPTNATGYVPGNQATLAPPALFGSAALRLGFAGRVPVGSKAGLMVNSGGLLTLAALAGLEINTYLSTSTTPQQSISLSQLLTLQVLNKGAAAAEFTVSKPFDHIELAAGGLVNAYSLGLEYVYADVAGPLPVELVAFTGRATPAGVLLNWQTASETNNSYFAIERAADGQATSFAELGQVAGAGNSVGGRHYQFTDAAPGAMSYYRLRQVDADGQVHYSSAVAVRALAVGSRLSAYPSLATATLVVASATEAHLSLFGARGELVRQYTVAAGQQPLDISTLPAGIYYLRDAATKQSTRFVKTTD
ncbi:MAG: hypothetical protein ACRYF0_01500 [Janthinobacterium lividum]